MMVTKHLIISGKVQQVGFRHFTRKNARRLGLNGWVKNLSDGRVEAVLQGEESAVIEMTGLLKEGPAYSRVTELVEKPADGESYNSFEVRY